MGNNRLPQHFTCLSHILSHAFAPTGRCSSKLPACSSSHALTGAPTCYRCSHVLSTFLLPSTAAPTRCPPLGTSTSRYSNLLLLPPPDAHLCPLLPPRVAPPSSICCPLNRRVPHSRKFIGVFMGSNHGKAETSLVSVACSDCALRRWRRQQ